MEESKLTQNILIKSIEIENEGINIFVKFN